MPDAHRNQFLSHSLSTCLPRKAELLGTVNLSVRYIQEEGLRSFIMLCCNSICNNVAKCSKQNKRKKKNKTEVLRDVRSQESGNKTSSGEIGLKKGQDQVSRGASILCWLQSTTIRILFPMHTMSLL